MRYTVQYNDGNTRGFGDYPCPDRLPRAGDIYATKVAFRTLATTYDVGDRFAILGRTQEWAHHQLSSLGNLVILCKIGKTVWTQFEVAVAEGRVELVVEGKAENEEINAILRRLEQKNPQPV